MLHSYRPKEQATRRRFCRGSNSESDSTPILFSALPMNIGPDTQGQLAQQLWKLCQRPALRPSERCNNATFRFPRVARAKRAKRSRRDCAQPLFDAGAAERTVLYRDRPSEPSMSRYGPGTGRTQAVFFRLIMMPSLASSGARVGCSEPWRIQCPNAPDLRDQMRCSIRKRCRAVDKANWSFSRNESGRFQPPTHDEAEQNGLCAPPPRARPYLDIDWLRMLAVSVEPFPGPTPGNRTMAGAVAPGSLPLALARATRENEKVALLRATEGP